MEEAGARRGTPASPTHQAGHYETAFRVIGRYMDDQRPRDVFFFEQGGAFVLRLLMSGQAGSRHELAEFTREDIADMVARGPSLRHTETAPAARPSNRQSSHRSRRYAMKALKTVAVALGITLAALIVIPLAVLAGLFVWLKVTEEDDEEILELDQEGV